MKTFSDPGTLCMLKDSQLCVACSRLSAFAILLISNASSAEPAKPAAPLATMPPVTINCHIGDACARPGNKHSGADYKGNAGTPVYAICDGTVYINNTWKGLWDSFLVIEHTDCGGYSKVFGYYGHISSQLNGSEVVKKGQKIGVLKQWWAYEKGIKYDNTHLHFGVNTKFSSPFGYEADVEPQTKGWLNPEIFLQETASVTKQINSPSPTKTTTTAKSESIPPSLARSPIQSDNKGRYRWQRNVDRKTIEPQDICILWIKEPYYLGAVLDVRHIYEADKQDGYGNHSCIVRYKKTYANSPTALLQKLVGSSTRERKETALHNVMANECKRIHGPGYAIVFGKDKTPYEGRVWCERNLGWTKVYY